MKISISNIAWDVSDDEMIANILNKNNINSIDIAPGKYFGDPINTSEYDIKQVRDWWNSKGIEINGLQALLFGTNGLNLFGSMRVRQSMLLHLESICRIASGLGAKHLVFGSPKNRDRKGLTEREVLEISIPFFKELGNIALEHSVEICIEPNPPIYGSNFITTSKDAALFVEKLGHSNIKMQLDTGTVIINNEDLESILIEHSHLIGHIHISEPNLIAYGQDKAISKCHGVNIKKYLQNHTVTIEMVKVPEDSNYKEVVSAIKTTKLYFS
jgi:D-psicose/D-tagatose/L-ribulose 3-epimerase